MPASADDITYVRLLIGDNYDDSQRLLSDNEIGVVIDREPTLKRAAAALLEMIAISEALTSKKIRTQDLSTDGPALAATLFAQAQRLRDQSDSEADQAVFVEPYDAYGPVPELTEPPYQPWWLL